MSGPLPSSAQPLTAGNFVTPIWQRWFNSLLSGSLPIATATVGASPYSFTAPASGSLFVSGGTVSAITITRGPTTINTGVTSGIIPLSLNDIATVTYTVLPSVVFSPT